MIKRTSILFVLLAICFWGRADGDTESNFYDDVANSAVRNSVKFNCDLITEEGSVEYSPFSDDFNMPLLRANWNSESITDGWTLKARPGFLRIKAQRINSGEDINTEKTFYQHVTLNACGEAVGLIDLSSLEEGTHAGLYFSSVGVNYIGVYKQDGEKRLRVRISDKTIEGPMVTDNTLLLRVAINVSKAWFEYSLNGVDFSKLGDMFQLSALSGINHSIGFYCLNVENDNCSVDIDWFYFNAKVDDTIRFSEVISEVFVPGL
jgi:beta-xylosidase